MPRRQWHRSGVFIVNFEDISHLALVFLLLTLGKLRFAKPFTALNTVENKNLMWSLQYKAEIGNISTVTRITLCSVCKQGYTNKISSVKV